MPILDHFGVIAPYYDRVIRPHTAEKLIKLANLPIKWYLTGCGWGHRAGGCGIPRPGVIAGRCRSFFLKC